MRALSARLLKLDRSGPPVHAQIQDRLAELIAAGGLEPGDRLPPERVLAGQLGVSRMTLRHALAALERRGLVTRAVGRGGGTFVSEPKIERDLTALAGLTQQLRRQGHVAGARLLAADEVAAGTQAAHALGVEAGATLYEVIRLRLSDAEPLALERSLFPAKRLPGLLEHPLDGSLYELLLRQYGLGPYRAVERLEPVCAAADEAEVLEIEEGAPLMLVERTAYSENGVPLELAHDLFRGDRTRVVVWTSQRAD